VLWPLGQTGHPGEQPWEYGATEEAGVVEFSSTVDIMVYESTRCLGPTVGWTYFAGPPIIIRVGDDVEFGFQPDDLFTASHVERAPETISAEMDIDDYLSGKQRSRPFRELDLPQTRRAK
jgi:hypothetical protein